MKFNGILKIFLILIINSISILSFLIKSKSKIKDSPARITIKTSTETIKHSNNRNLYNASSHILIKNPDLPNTNNTNKINSESESNTNHNSNNLKTNRPYEKSILHKKKKTLNNNSTSIIEKNDMKNNNNNFNSKKPKAKNDTILIRNKFYDICFMVFNYSETSVSCEKAEMLEEIYFNCDDKKFEELKNKLSKYSYNNNTEKVIKIINQKSFTMEMRKDIFKYSSCLKDTPVLELDFGIDFINRNQMRINLQNGFLESKESNYHAEPIFSFSPLGAEMDLKVIIAEINKSQRLLRNSFAAESQEDNLNKLEDITLSEKNDLQIKKAEVFSEKEEFNEKLLTHKRLYLCAENELNSAYHFLIDKTTRDPRMEKAIMQSAESKKHFGFIHDDKRGKTSIRVIYINKTNNCNEEFNSDKIGEVNEKEFFGIENKLENENEYKVIENKSFNKKANRISKENSSFRNLLVAIQRYALDNQSFSKEKDSGFFLEGFFNYLISNKGVNRIRIENDLENRELNKKEFDAYFGEESDQVFIDKLKYRMIN